MDTIEIIRDDRKVILNAKHFLYQDDINNHFNYYFEAVFPKYIGDYLTVDFSKPAYHNVPGWHLFPVLFPSFVDATITTRQYIDFAQTKEGDVIFDLGAYSGLTAMLFKQHVGKTGKVVAVEADAENLKALVTNLANFEAYLEDHVSIVYGAVWNHNEGISFSGDANMGSAAAVHVGERGTVELVPSFTLSRLAEITKVKKVDFIKCDIEAAESVIFEDNIFFSRFRPKILVEPHNIFGKNTTEKVIKDLTRVGYSCVVQPDTYIYCTPLTAPVAMVR